MSDFHPGSVRLPFRLPKLLLLTVIVDVVIWLVIQWNPAWSVATMYVHPPFRLFAD